METQQQAAHETSQETFSRVYQAYSGKDFGDPSDSESEPFLNAFSGLVQKIIDEKIECRFKVTHEEAHGYTATKLREGHYFVELRLEHNTPKSGYYKAYMTVRAENFEPTKKEGKPVVIGQGKIRRPSKVLPFIFNVFGLVKPEQEVSQIDISSEGQ